MPVATGAPRDESVGAGWHGGGRPFDPSTSSGEPGSGQAPAPGPSPGGRDDTALRRAQHRRGGRGLFSYQRRWGLLASHAARGRAGFKPAPTAPRYAVWGRTRGVTFTPTLSRQGLTRVGKQNRSYDQAKAASACHSERSEESRVPAYGRRCLAVSDLRFFTPLRFVQNDSAGVVF